MKIAVVSGYLGNVLYIPEQGKAFDPKTQKEAKRTKFKIELNFLEKWLKYSKHISDIRLDEVYVTKGSNQKIVGGKVEFIPIIEQVSKDEFNAIKEDHFPKVVIQKTKEEENQELKERLAEMEAKMEKLLSENGKQDDLQPLREEYEQLAGKKPNKNWKEETLKEKIEELQNK